MDELKIEDMIQTFGSLSDKPVKYLTVQTDLKEDIKNLVKSLYDYTKRHETTRKSKQGALAEIIVKDFDEEQIWQQIELQNTECWDELVWDVANCMTAKNDLTFPVQIAQAQEELSDGHVDVSDPEESLPKSKKKKKSSKLKNKKQLKTKTKSSIVDDEFFKLQDMEKFLINEEKMESKADKKKSADSDEESIDMFDIDDEGSEEEEGDKRDMMYSDFFEGENGDYNEEESDASEDESNDTDEEEHGSQVDDSIKPKKKEKSVRFATPESEESDSDDKNSDIEEKVTKNGHIENEKKSEFELRQQRLRQQISKLEEKTLTDAPWQLKGEVDALKRPQNSLLEEVVDFDLTTRPPPVITEQTTLTLEDIVKHRIKDKAWDDVVKKEKPVDDQLVFRKPEVLDQNKSKLSLAQVYEAEYLKQKQALSGGNEEEKEPESHIEIRDATSKLFAKLDALCHYHYTPKAPQAEVKIVSNTPAISMEEVAPVATSDAALLAPEEVKKKHRGDLMSKAERTQTDKNRERRKKKKLQRKKGNVMKVTEVRNTTKGVEANDKALKTSKAFFQQLNDDSTSLIKSKTNRNVKNKGQ